VPMMNFICLYAHILFILYIYYFTFNKQNLFIKNNFGKKKNNKFYKSIPDNAKEILYLKFNFPFTIKRYLKFKWCIIYLQPNEQKM
jgi:hypothetical protein